MKVLEEYNKNNQYILVTGGAGFIGSHLCEALLKLGYKVINIDNINEFYSPAIKRANIKEAFKLLKDNNIDEENYIFLEGDILDKLFLNNLFNTYHIGCIIHLAAWAGVRPSIENPGLYMDVNVTGTVNLLEMAKKNNIKKFLFASSSSVYGNNTKVPFAEDDSVDFPISPYAASKKAGELICHSYHKLYDMSIACLRFFTVYGPRQRPDLAIHKFTRCIYEGKNIPFFGDGSTKRDYTFIEDILDGVIKSFYWVSLTEEAKYDIFNLGESKTISLQEMVAVLEKATGIEVKLEMLPSQPGDVNLTNADISKSKSILGYNPQIEFEKGIKIFIDWYRNIEK